MRRLSHLAITRQIAGDGRQSVAQSKGLFRGVLGEQAFGVLVLKKKTRGELAWRDHKKKEEGLACFFTRSSLEVSLVTRNVSSSSGSFRYGRAGPLFPTTL